MGSLTKKYKEEKLKGVVYTPYPIVEKILNDIGYNNNNILGKTILDPACGDGSFIINIVKKIIKYSPKERLRFNLQKIHGWDIDENAINICVKKLNKLILKHNIKINWNIKKNNSLENIHIDNIFNKDEIKNFDYIVGNPPYVRIQHLEDTMRKFIQKNYFFCNNGSTDIYIAFFELCYKLLNKNGICGLITPNTYFYTETAKKMRDFLVKNKCIKQITNYSDIQMFDNVTTYSAITIIEKKVNHKFLYQQAIKKDELLEKWINVDELSKQNIWQLTHKNIKNRKGKKLKDICNIHVGITTLYDKIYIFKTEYIDNDYVYALTKLKGKIKIERSILKPIIKGSRIKSSDQPIEEYIIFPYQKINEKHKIINENIFREHFPLAYEYLFSLKEELNKRDNGKPIKPWYAFGRTQSLDNSFGKKIVFSPMNKEPNFILYENEDCTIYSGYFIKYDGDYEYLLKKLNSKEFNNFIEISSRNFRGGWKAYNKKIICEYYIE